MELNEIQEKLKRQHGKLAEFGVKSLAVFGSVARHEERPDSDVDFLVEFDGPATFDSYVNLKEFLEGLLQRRVDLVTRKSIRPQLAPYIEGEARRVA